MARGFVEGFLGIVTGSASDVPLGALPAAYAVTRVAFLLGGLLFGIATVRAGILLRWAGGLLAAGRPLSALAVALLPHALEPFGAVPTELALAWLGYALGSERREGNPERASVEEHRRRRRTGTR